MGNRGGIEIWDLQRTDGTIGKVCLYSHWEGCFLAEFVRRTLRWTHDRWTDAPYLTKFMVMDITEGRSKESLNLTISSELPYIQHRIVVVDVLRQRIRFERPSDRSDVSREWSFEEYLRASPKELDRAYHKGCGGYLTRQAREELDARLREITRPGEAGLDEWLATLDAEEKGSEDMAPVAVPARRRRTRMSRSPRAS